MASLALLVAAAGAGAATVNGYRSACGIELVPTELTLTGGGPICGSDGNDTASYGDSPTPVSFFGETGRDTITGSPLDDRMQGGPGNDRLDGGPGNDVIDGGDDSDTVFGGPGDDRIIERRFGVRETFHGGEGADTIAGGRGTDTIYGDDGPDILLGGTGSDVLVGGEGNDRLFGGPNRDRFDCGPGEDTVYRIRSTTDRRIPTSRPDGSVAGKGCEIIHDVDPTADFALREKVGGSGRDDLVGGPGRDFLQGKGGSDRMFGGGGDDELEGDGASRQGRDLMMGGSGRDRLAGRAGSDKLYGDARSPNAGPPGADEIVGGRGGDLMVGGPGGDLILGAYDGDRIQAGSGNDVINLLGGDTSNANGRAFVDCGRGRDVVVVNPTRKRGVYRNCESLARQFHEADFGFLYRPSPETYP